MRVAVYTDYTYRRRGDAVYSERAFSLFVAAVAARLDGALVLGRVAAGAAEARYPIGEGVGFVELPFYESLSRPASVFKAMWGSVKAFWGALGEVECVWLLGPHPIAVSFAFLALARRRRVVLGVRQDTPRYVRTRRPGKRGLLAAAHLLEGLWRLLACFLPVVVVGPDLADRYSRSPRLLEIAVSLVSERDIAPAHAVEERQYDGVLRVITVGRLEQEKNPLLLADILVGLRADGRDWRLLVVGEGEMREALSDRLERLGVAASAELLGYVPIDGGLMETYRSAHAFLHVSWTEGLPQVLLEAFAAALPVVATDVGGVRAAVGDAASLVAAGDAAASAAAVRELIDDRSLRAGLVARGLEYVESRTIEAESARLARFLVTPAP